MEYGTIIKFAEFYNFTFEGLEIWVVLISAKRDSGNERMNMSTELLNEIERLDHFVQNLTVVCKDETIRFKDTQGAQINYLFNWYKFAYYWSDYVADINLTFPVASAMGHKFFLGSHFFGVNKHKDTERGPIETMEHVTLWYMSQANNFTQKKRLEAIQMKLFQLSKEDQFSDILSFEMYGDQVANAEMLRGTLYTIKLFLIGVVMMVIFMLFMYFKLTYLFIIQYLNVF
uniref:Uncharacterized protein n=1 Tax=Heterorhabditis bacteriophora TaxID=37862 RepID=A0A1I7X8K4_HETBA